MVDPYPHAPAQRTSNTGTWIDVTARAELTTKLKNSPSKSSLRVLDLPWGMICHDIYLAVERIAKIIRDFGYIKVKQQVAEFAEVAALVGNAHTELAAVFIFII